MNLIILFVLLAVSLCLNAGQFYLSKRQKKKAPLTIEAKQLLHDLTHGGAAIRIEVLDPMGLMYYRGQK